MRRQLPFTGLENLHGQGHRRENAVSFDCTEARRQLSDNASGATNADNPVRRERQSRLHKKHDSGNVYLDQNRDKTKNTGDMPTCSCHREVASINKDGTGNYDRCDGNSPSTGLERREPHTPSRCRQDRLLADGEQTEDPSGKTDFRARRPSLIPTRTLPTSTS